MHLTLKALASILLMLNSNTAQHLTQIAPMNKHATLTFLSILHASKVNSIYQNLALKNHHLILSGRKSLQQNFLVYKLKSINSASVVYVLVGHSEKEPENTKVAAMFRYRNGLLDNMYYYKSLKRSFNIEKLVPCANWYCSLAKVPFTKVNGYTVIHYRAISGDKDKSCDYIWQYNKFQLLTSNKPKACILVRHE